MSFFKGKSLVVNLSGNIIARIPTGFNYVKFINVFVENNIIRRNMDGYHCGDLILRDTDNNLTDVLTRTAMNRIFFKSPVSTLAPDIVRGLALSYVKVLTNITPFSTFHAEIGLQPVMTAGTGYILREPPKLIVTLNLVGDEGEVPITTYEVTKYGETTRFGAGQFLNGGIFKVSGNELNFEMVDELLSSKLPEQAIYNVNIIFSCELYVDLPTV